MAKQNALARERRIVATISVLALVVVAAGLFLWNRQLQQDPAAEPSASDTTGTESPAPEPGALPTTNPQTYQAPPPASDSLDQDWSVVIHTNMGDVAATLDGAAAPQTVASFVMLASNGFFDGTACHRLLPDSLLQCGDPTASGSGGPGYSFGPIENAPTDDVYPAGTIAMARQPDNAESQGSQFFLVFNDVPLPSDTAGGYSVFGTIDSGLEILQAIGAAGTADGSPDGQPIENVIIESVEVQ
ncbi:peptidylprolyl isomerase [Occultella glacieicola]|uniref:Peptidylprolyl isomerase n=2 Tax=Occultella glacieicola TaxID=2518684 RepID=A0ABY2E7F8_9MICO|nr:peptidylprolyl isomerase [Occultella glacieicola]